MKKIISVLVALLLVVTSLSAFAEVNSSSGTHLAFDGIDYAEGMTIDPLADSSIRLTSSNSPFSAPDNKNLGTAAAPDWQIVTDAVVSGGALVISTHRDNGPWGEDGSGKDLYQYQQSQLYAIYKDFNSIKGYDELLYGFDIKIDGATHVRDVIYKTDNTTYNPNSYTVFSVGGRAASPRKDVDPSSTSGTYWYGGNNLAFYLTRNDGEYVLDDNGMPYITIGSKTNMKQGEVYKVKVYMDYTTHKYTVSIADSQGNEEICVPNGTLLECLQDFGGVSFSQALNVTKETKVTIDNYFVDEAALKIDVPSSYEVSADGKINYSVFVPQNCKNPTISINGTQVETISQVPGQNLYSVTSTLPEGTAFGNAVIKLDALRNGAPVSTTANVELTKFLRKPISYTGLNNTAAGTDTDGVAYYGTGDTRTKALNPTSNVDGLYEVGLKFKPNTGKTTLNLRLRSNNYTAPSGSVSGQGALFDSSTDPWKSWEVFSGVFANAGVSRENWNTAKLVADYRGNALTGAQPYSMTINGVTHNGTFKMSPNATINGFIEVGVNTVYFRDLYINELVNVTSDGVVLTYLDKTTAEFEDEALASVNLDKVTFKLSAAFAAADKVRFVDSKGDDVSNVTITVNGEEVIVSPSTILPTGNYKLVVDKTSAFNGEALGANFEVPVALNADDQSLIEEGTVVTDKINLSAFAANATKVVFKVDDETVKTFAAPEADGIYEFLYTPSIAGEHVFDAYVYGANGVNLVSSNFNYLVDAKMLEASNDMNDKKSMSVTTSSTKGEFVDGVGRDGSVAYKVESTIGNGATGGTSNSNTSSFAPGGKYRVMVTEFEMKAEANTYVYAEIGYGLAGKTYSEDTAQYKTFYIRGSYSDSSKIPAIFEKTGTILGTTMTYNVGQWYKFKQVIDLVNLTNTWYVDDEFLVQDDLSNLVTGADATAYPNWKDDIVIATKYKVCVLPIDESKVTVSDTNTVAQPATIYLDNYKRWHPVEVPTVDAVTANGAAIVNNVIAAGTDAVTVALDKDFYALAANNIAVTVDGEAVGTVSVADTKTFTVSGLANVAAGKKIEVKILKDNLSVPFNGNTAAVKSDYVFYIYVGDGNKVCLYPLSVESAAGADLTAYSKYINGSSSALNTYLIMTEYANDAKTLVAQTNFAPVTIKAGKVGAVSGYLTGITKAEGCQVMLWNTDFAPLLEAGALAQ